MRKLVLSILFFFNISSLAAQFYIAGQEPRAIKWFEQKTPYGKTIFPLQSDTIAFYFNNYMQYALDNVPSSLDHYPKPFSVVIHPNSILSNGFVTWGPKRMEIISQHDLNASPEPWLLTLSLHETRHIVQVDKLNKGVFRIGTFILGEQGIAPAVALVPLWFLEGDAVYTETDLSLGGRGRQASFYQYYRTHLLHHGRNKFSYDKWLMGSYKNYIPNHYQFGYLMVGYGNLKYESNLWVKSLDRVTRRPYSLFPFYFSIKNETGLSRKNFFLETLNYLDSIWRDIGNNTEVDSFNQIINCEKSYSEYRHPYMVNDSMLVALKKTLTKQTSIVAYDLKKRQEKILHIPGLITDRVSYNNGSLYWSEFRSHYRWEHLNYSEIWRYNIESKKATKITKQSRFFNPVAMNNGTILAIEYNSNGQSSIIALSPFGYPTACYTFQNTLEPKEIAVGSETDFYVRASSPNGTIILKFISIDSHPDTIMGPVFRDISNINFYNDHIIFTMTNNCKEDIFAYDINAKKNYLIGNSLFGFINPSTYNDQIIASMWNETGSYPISFLPKNANNEFEVDRSTKGLFCEGSDIDLTSLSVRNFGNNSQQNLPTKYSKIKNILRFHSWAPFYFNPFSVMDGDFSFYPGLSILSQNLTSTLASSFGYSYNETHGGHAHIHWMGWYPIITLGMDYGNVHPKIIQGPLAEDPENPRNDYNLETSINVRFPFRLSSGKFFTQFNLGFKYLLNNTWLWNYKRNYYEEYYDNFEIYLSFYSLSRMAYRDIRPRSGVSLYAGFSHSPFINHLMGNNFVARGGVYIPGVGPNHSVLITGQAEKQWVTGYIFSSRLKLPRGYEQDVNKGFNSISLDYLLPLGYPDFHLGPIVYLKRFYANVFYDHAYINGYKRIDGNLSVHDYPLNSTGVELYSDVNLFLTRYELRFGYRLGVTIPHNDFFHEFLMSINPSTLFGHIPKHDYILFK
jgi:hypothetical protein